jgi:gamma-aminobutyric acid receptor subunit beta
MRKIDGLRRLLIILLVLISSAWVSSLAQAAKANPVAGVDMSRPNSDAGPTEVSVAMWLLDIDSINSSDQNFIANVFIKLSWKDKRLAHSNSSNESYKVDQVWTPVIQIANEIGIVRRTLPELVHVTRDGTVTYRQRFVGPFSQPLKLNDFPFDGQTFQIQLLPSGTSNTPKDINFVADREWIENGLKDAGGISDNISLPDWKIEGFDAHPQVYVVTPQFKTAGYVFEFVAKRDVRHYIWKVILPLLFIVVMSWSVFWIDPSNSGTQIAVAMTSMLTLIAYRFAIDAQVPRVPYMTKLDQFMLVGTIFVFLSLLQVIITSRLFQSGRVELSRKVDRLSRVLFPSFFVVGLVLSLIG